MSDTIIQGTVSSAAEKAQIDHAQVPLSFLRSGEKARVAKVRGKGEMHHHLETLGFVNGAEVSVVCKNGGNLIVEVKGSQIAINNQVAAKIITR